MTRLETTQIVDELLDRRALSAMSGIVLTVEELCEGRSDEVREELSRRLDDILAAEEAIEASFGVFDDDEAFKEDLLLPVGCADRYTAPEYKTKGGMGILCVAFDEELKRKVAYKVMKPGKGGRRNRNPLAVRNFFNEAEITARLTHPGIVQVFGRVVDGNGLPAYAAEYVTGRTLADAIQSLRDLPADAGKACAAARRKLVESFVSACRIVAYAHSENVIHCDLKPSNIMIDDFGSTRVVDWGVAQVVSPVENGRSNEAETFSFRSGTSHYISRFDSQATKLGDVYGLGVTLKLILAEPTAGDGRLPERPAADASLALWAAAEKAMMIDHADRYGSVLDFVSDVEAVLADKPIAPYRDLAPTRIRRWADQNRIWVVAGFGILLATAVVVSLFAGRESSLRRIADDQRRSADKIADEMIEQAALIGKFQATLPGSKALLERVVQLINQRASDGEKHGSDTRPIAEQYYRAGLIQMNLGRLGEAAECFDHSIRLTTERYEARPDDFENRDRLAVALRDRGVALYHQGKSNEAQKAWNDALKAVEPVADASPEYRWDLARIHLAIGNRTMLAGNQTTARVAFGKALDLASKLVERSPDDTRFINTLADVRSNQGISFESEAARIGSPRNLDLLAKATASHQDALKLRRRRARLEPGEPEPLADVAISLNLLGNAAYAVGEAGFDDAKAYYREAIPIVEALVVAYPGMLINRQEAAKLYSNLNVLFTARNRPEEGITFARAAVASFDRLLADYPETPDLLSGLGVASRQLADNLRSRGEIAEADQAALAAAVAFVRAVRLTGDPNLRDDYVKTSLTILKELEAAGYFRDPEHALSLQSERAFDEFRSRPEFPKGN